MLIWYRDDPTGQVVLERARASSAGDAEAAIVGPLLAVRYPSLIDYASCRTEGARVIVPIRVVPHPTHYGDGVPDLPAALPARVECQLVPSAGPTLVVAALSGVGTVALIAPDSTRSTVGRETALCFPSSTEPRALAVEIEARNGAGGSLDLYDVPLGVGCPGGG